MNPYAWLIAGAERKPLKNPDESWIHKFWIPAILILACLGIVWTVFH